MKINFHSDEKHLNTYHATEMVLVKPVLIILAVLYIPWFFALKYDVALQYKTWFILWTLLVLAYGVRSYLIWSLNRYVITSKRLIRLLHLGVFRRVVMETPLERILNISFKTTGFWSSLFKFGDVEVQVVGLIEPIILKSIKHPQQVKDYLWQLHQKVL
jgi:uncharacterized membrane protein YdbT with pleckstrin-like domain